MPTSTIGEARVLRVRQSVQTQMCRTFLEVIELHSF
jgi:hypothetical protein